MYGIVQLRIYSSHHYDYSNAVLFSPWLTGRRHSLTSTTTTCTRTSSTVLSLALPFSEPTKQNLRRRSINLSIVAHFCC